MIKCHISLHIFPDLAFTVVMQRDSMNASATGSECDKTVSPIRMNSPSVCFIIRRLFTTLFLIQHFVLSHLVARVVNGVKSSRGKAIKIIKKSVFLVSHESVVEKSFRQWKRITIPVANAEVHLINFESSSGMFACSFRAQECMRKLFLPFILRNQLSFVSYSNPLILIFTKKKQRFRN